MVTLKINRKGRFFAGVAIFALLAASYFIKIKIDSGDNYVTYDSVLGILIFHNPFVLGIYILAGVILIVIGVKGKRHKNGQRKN